MGVSLSARKMTIEVLNIVNAYKGMMKSSGWAELVRDPDINFVGFLGYLGMHTRPQFSNVTYQTPKGRPERRVGPASRDLLISKVVKSPI